MNHIKVRSLAELQPQQPCPDRRTLPYPIDTDDTATPFRHWFNPQTGNPEPFGIANVEKGVDGTRRIDEGVRFGLIVEGAIVIYDYPVIANVADKSNGRSGGWVGLKDDPAPPPTARAILLLIISVGLLAFWLGATKL